MSKILLISYEGPDVPIDTVREWTQKALDDRSYVLHVGERSSTCYFAIGGNCQNRKSYTNDQMADAFDRLKILRKNGDGVIICQAAHKDGIVQMLGDTEYEEINPAELEPSKDRPLSKEDFRYSNFDLKVRRTEAALRLQMRNAEHKFSQGLRTEPAETQQPRFLNKYHQRFTTEPAETQKLRIERLEALFEQKLAAQPVYNR